MAESIPHYKNDPETNAKTAPELKLYRPEIHYGKAAIYIGLHILVAIIITFVWVLISSKSFPRTISAFFPKLWITLCICFLVSLRFSFIWFVRVYQHYAKSETRLRCCMTPSCSEYAILAFKKYGAIWGGIKTFRRLLRCHPPGGVDYP